MLNTLLSGMVASWNEICLSIMKMRHCMKLRSDSRNMLYNGLNAHTQMVVDAFANEISLDKSYNDAYEILERTANNNYQYPTTRMGTGRRVVGAMELDAITLLTAQVSSLTNMIKTLKRLPAV
ncbi:hypothetical protein EPI10_006520 [Gossypium australe]|uniref:Uncharacterized protein n=1 Tax=Gossypium australe TaxID=47621 RepID=A0A5B6WT22_9ROSI|nr:hypothetical protein EPI10_006520 [Gossypium australe]